MCREAAKKAGRYLLTRQFCYLGVLPMPPMRCIGQHQSDQAEDKRPKALALATACVRLWTPSLL